MLAVRAMADGSLLQGAPASAARVQRKIRAAFWQHAMRAAKATHATRSMPRLSKEAGECDDVRGSSRDTQRAHPRSVPTRWETRPQVRMGDWIAFRGQRRFVVGVRRGGIELARLRQRARLSAVVHYSVGGKEKATLRVLKPSTPSTSSSSQAARINVSAVDDDRVERRPTDLRARPGQVPALAASTTSSAGV